MTDRIDGSVEERFWPKVDAEGDCWEWTASTSQGYGRFRVEGSGNRWHYAHRIAWSLLVGPIPPGLTIDHLCRNRRCVNPDHLEPVPERENIARGMAPTARAHRLGRCRRGHVYTEQTSYLNRRGTRMCRPCGIIRRREWRDRHMTARTPRAAANRDADGRASAAIVSVACVPPRTRWLLLESPEYRPSAVRATH